MADQEKKIASLNEDVARAMGLTVGTVERHGPFDTSRPMTKRCMRCDRCVSGSDSGPCHIPTEDYVHDPMAMMQAWAWLDAVGAGYVLCKLDSEFCFMFKKTPGVLSNVACGGGATLGEAVAHAVLAVAAALKKKEK